MDSPALTDLSFRRVLDIDGVLTAYTDSVPVADEADALLEALFDGRPEAPGEAAYYWILHGVVDSTWTLASRLHRPCRGSPVDGRLHEADRLTIVVLMPQSPWEGKLPANDRLGRWKRDRAGRPGEPAPGGRAPGGPRSTVAPLREPCSDSNEAFGPRPAVAEALGHGARPFAPVDTVLRHAARAGTVVRKEESAASRGVPEFLALVLSGFTGLLSEDEAQYDEPIERSWDSLSVPAFDVAVHTTGVPFPDATIRALVEVHRDWVVRGAGPSPQSLGTRLHARVARARTQLLLGYVGYTQQVGAVFDALRGVFESARCPAPAADALEASAPPATVACSHALEDTLVQTVATMDLDAEHRARAVQKGAREALLIFETLLAAPARSREGTFRVVERSRIGFSVGGLLEEEEADKLSFTVKDGAVVADGVEGEGFRSLALVDVYLTPVDLGDVRQGFHPHLSVGFSVGESFRPALFGALPLCAPGLFCVTGRASLIGGVILRRETEAEAGSVEAGEASIDEQLRVRLAWGFKISLPVSP